MSQTGAYAWKHAPAGKGAYRMQATIAETATNAAAATAWLPFKVKWLAGSKPGCERHTTVGITLDTYSNAVPDIQEEAAKRLDGALAIAMGNDRHGTS
jgi:hypothetical protein